ncbi:hypothetical protein [Thalassotalea sp. ND16A]|uniref:hypothetical protein n=1 Tax=Thalassotalea sp. ND16A TaxID=1535422 RepID=UPI00051DC2F0|nr:hypothetical protein [Thalassotalea sp. ND16A]KGJ99086.1 hypothetical protein ND16A_0387 [Thalassotalea sp. ND16A]
MMNISKILFTILFVLLLGGCSSLKAVDTIHVNSHSELVKYIEVGDEVLVVTKQGVTHEFIIKAINSDAIAGDEVKIPFTDIEKMNKKEFSLLKTGGAVGGTWIILSILVFAYIGLIA